MGTKHLTSLIMSRPFEVFLAVAQQRSFTRAGQILGISQSAVSQQISALQRQLGFDLFEKSVRPHKLTPEALILQAELHSQNASFEQTLLSLQKRNCYKPILKIGAVESMIFNLSSFFFQNILRGFSKVHLQSGVTNDLIEKLISNKIDVVIASDHLLDSEKFLKLFLFSEPHIVILPKKIAKKHEVWDWDEIKLIGLPFAHYTSNTSSSHQTDRFFNENIGLVPSRIEVDSNRLVFSLVESGLAWGITQPSALLAEGEVMFEKLSFFPVPGKSTFRSIYAYSRADYPLPWLHKIREIFLSGLKADMLPRLQRCLVDHPDICSGLSTADSQPYLR